MTDAEKEAEQHRLRRTTRHLILSVAAVGIFALAFVGIYLTTSREAEPPEPTPTPSESATLPPPPADRETLLLQATTAVGAVGSMLTAVAPLDSPGAPPAATILPLPADLIVSAPSVAPQPVSRTVASIDTLRPATTVAATLGVRVDASWRMDRKALAGLVDSVGGVPVTVPEPIRLRDEEGLTVLRLKAGRTRLSGTDASWFAVGSARRDTAAMVSERFTAVLLATLRRLPTTDVEIRESLTALGALAPSTIGTQELAQYLLELSTVVRAGDAVVEALPVAQISFADTSAAWLRYDGATPRLRQLLPFAQWRAGVDGPPRVLVSAPTGSAAALSDARIAVTEAGLVFVDGRATPAAPASRTRILVRGDALLGEQVAAALGTSGALTEVLPATPVRGVPWADADVALATGYRTGGTGTVPPTLTP